MEVQFEENTLTAEEFLRFQQEMGWPVDPKAQWEKALQNTLYSLKAVKDGSVIAMGRLVGDGAAFWYLNDIFIRTDFQGQGLGRAIVTRLLTYVKENSLPGTEVSVCLMAAKGKEGFYEKLGFHTRPYEYEGAGMELELCIPPV